MLIFVKQNEVKIFVFIILVQQSPNNIVFFLTYIYVFILLLKIRNNLCISLNKNQLLNI
ncbi:hypothetical protein NIES267_12720 [Calothrix parasitica NIES-267]|uniref:Transmembrane protein n=1 Tax=Calothrix parasitica NIES-267 TaxID=1973488 RepID=A0A1Z4LKQ6_9CYAN|nr:hypothetical protein NIES267_12720 [Calothrix parasitica NIES-267]